jgi:putative transposase
MNATTCDGRPIANAGSRRSFARRCLRRGQKIGFSSARNAEGKLHLCAIKGTFSTRIVGWSVNSRMRLAVAAIEVAGARRGEVADYILSSYRDANR